VILILLISTILAKALFTMGEKIITPHPRMHQRNFTLIPLYEIKKKLGYIQKISKKLIF